MIKIKKSKNGQFYSIITSRNGKVLTTSETYRSKQGCLHGIKSMLQNLSVAAAGERWVENVMNQVVDETPTRPGRAGLKKIACNKRTRRRK